MSIYWIIAITVGLLIIAGLAWYAFILMRKLRTQTEQQKQQQLAIEKNHQTHDAKVLKSVEIIVKAMKEEQCDLSEGCWRLAVLLDSLKLSSELNTQFPAIYALHEKIKHMPILEERKKLEKRARMKLDLERMKAQSALTEDIKKDCELLAQYTQERLAIFQPAQN